LYVENFPEHNITIFFLNINNIDKGLKPLIGEKNNAFREEVGSCMYFLVSPFSGHAVGK
jgi:hypothetical protein